MDILLLCIYRGNEAVGRSGKVSMVCLVYLFLPCLTSFNLLFHSYYTIVLCCLSAHSGWLCYVIVLALSWPLWSRPWKVLWRMDGAQRNSQKTRYVGLPHRWYTIDSKSSLWQSRNAISTTNHILAFRCGGHNGRLWDGLLSYKAHKNKPL